MKKFDKVVPDTSVVIEGLLSSMIEKKDIFVNNIIIHEAVLAELESQANKGRDTGVDGLEEISCLRKLCSDNNIKLEYKGSRPGDFEIKFAKSGEIDSLIRHLAFEEKGTLFTADIVQAKVAEAKGIDVFLYEFEDEEVKLSVDEYFSEDTMSVYIKEGCRVRAKRGLPGTWDYVYVSDGVVSGDDVKRMHSELFDCAKMSEGSFVESDRRGIQVLQVNGNRVVYVKPPVSDSFELTIVRQIKKLEIGDYSLSEKLKNRLLEGAEGVLVAGAPGQGKTTFVRAVASEFLSAGRSIRTVESPRDLDLDPEVSQYSLNYSSASDLQDVLLLSRPDFTFFDEIRNGEDFKLFRELRLAGIGMFGVIHAQKAIDAVHRFVSRMELGLVPHVLDTIIFVKGGVVVNVLSLDIRVKVPFGMSESDLARPVVVVSDFETGLALFEIYSYGEQVTVVPVSSDDKSGCLLLAEKYLNDKIAEKFDFAKVRVIDENTAELLVPEDSVSDVLGKSGSNIRMLESKFGLKFKVSSASVVRISDDKKEVKFSVEETSKDVVIFVKDVFDREVSIYFGDDFFMNVKVSKKGKIKMGKGSSNGKILADAVKSGKSVRILC